MTSITLPRITRKFSEEHNTYRYNCVMTFYLCGEKWRIVGSGNDAKMSWYNMIYQYTLQTSSYKAWEPFSSEGSFDRRICKELREIENQIDKWCAVEKSMYRQPPDLNIRTSYEHYHLLNQSHQGAYQSKTYR